VFSLDHRAAFLAYAKRFKGEEVVLTLHKRRAKRSSEQNRYWHGVVVALLAEHCGYTRDEMHEALKARFLGQEDLSRGLIRIGSTAKLTTLEFADLVDRVVLWAAEELGVVIPLPEKEPAKRKKAA
jgi:hypothetical protein